MPCQNTEGHRRKSTGDQFGLSLGACHTPPFHPLPFLAFCASSALPTPSFDFQSLNPQHSLSRFFDSPARGPRSLLRRRRHLSFISRFCVDRQLSFLGAIVICRPTRLSAQLQTSQPPILHRIENRGIGVCVRKQHIRYARRPPGGSLGGLVNQTAVNCHPSSVVGLRGLCLWFVTIYGSPQVVWPSWYVEPWETNNTIAPPLSPCLSLLITRQRAGAVFPFSPS